MHFISMTQHNFDRQMQRVCGTSSVSCVRRKFIMGLSLTVNLAHYRTLNHHGQEVCRLAIDQGILAIPTNSGTYIYQGKAFRIVSRLMFDFPTSYHTRLETVYTDQMVNTNHWSRLMESCQAEWKACLVVVSLRSRSHEDIA